MTQFSTHSTSDTYAAALIAPSEITIASVVTDVLTWVGLGPLAVEFPLPASPVSTSFEMFWLAVRQSQYRWNNQRPNVSPAITGRDEDTGVITGDLNATDFEGDTLTFTISTLPKHGTLDILDDGTFRYTPDPAFAATGGPDSFTVTVDDIPGNPPHSYGILGLLGVLGPTTATMSLTIAPVAPPNRAPRTGQPPYGSQVDTASGIVTGAVNVTDPDGDELAFSLDTDLDAAVGAIELNAASGAWQFVPTTAARETAHGTIGADEVHFVVSVTDGVESVTVPISVAITPLAPRVNNAPHSDGPTVDPATLLDGKVTGALGFVDEDNDTLAYAVTSGPERGTVTISEDGTFAYVTDPIERLRAALSGSDVTDFFVVTASDNRGEAAEVSVEVTVDPAKLATIDTVSLGAVPSASAASPDGQWIYVGDAATHTVRVINTSSGEALGEPIPLGAIPHFVVADETGESLYVVAIDSDTLSPTVTVVDLATRSVLDDPVRLDFTPSAATLSGSRLYLADSVADTVTVIDTTSNEILGEISVGASPLALTTSPDGARLYVANSADDTVSVIDTATGAVVGEIAVGHSPLALVVSPDGSRLYVANADDTVLTIDTALNAVSGPPVLLPSSPSSLALSTDGSLLYITSTADDTVVVVDTITRTAVGDSVAVGNAPLQVLRSDAATTAYVVNADGTVSVISVSTISGTPVVTPPPTPTVNALTGTVAGSVGITNPAGVTFEVSKAPTYGVVEVRADGTYVYTPSPGARQAASANSLTDEFVVTARAASGATTTIHVPVTVSAVSPLTVVGTVSDPGAQHSTVLSPDGKRIYTDNGGYDDGGQFIVIDAETGTVLHSTESQSLPGPMVITPDGRRAYIASTSFYIDVYDTGYRGEDPSVDPEFLGSIRIPTTSGSYTNVNLIASPDGTRIYVPHGAASVYVLDAATNTFIDVDPSTETSIEPIDLDGYAGEYVMSRDGERIYVSPRLGATGENLKLQIIDTSNYQVQSVSLPKSPSEMSVSADGEKVILINPSSGTLMVVDTTDLTLTEISVGTELHPSASAVSNYDGSRIYLAGYHDVVVVAADPATGEMQVVGRVVSPLGSLNESSDIRNLILSPDGARLYVVGDANARYGSGQQSYVVVIDAATTSMVGGRTAVLDRSLYPVALSADGRRLVLIGTQDLERTLVLADTGTSNAVAPPPNTSPEAPESVQDLWDNVQRYAQGNHDSDGIYIQTVKSDDGKTRMIVYLGGTTDDNTDQSKWENISAYIGITKDDQIAAIDEALRMCSASASCGGVDEIMLVGYSQGGIDAQNLAMWNWLGGVTGQPNQVPVTSVVTFGSPVTAVNPGIATIHIQDEADEVVNMVSLAEATIPLPWQIKAFLAARQAAAAVGGDVFSARSTTPETVDLMHGVHATPDTYKQLSALFEATPSGQFANQKTQIALFLDGNLVDPSDPRNV